MFKTLMIALLGFGYEIEVGECNSKGFLMGLTRGSPFSSY